MLITPVVTQVLRKNGVVKNHPDIQSASSVRGYFPSTIWYSLYDFNYGRVQQPGYSTLSAPTTSLIPVHVRGSFTNKLDQ
jgi:hypothetical protein